MNHIFGCNPLPPLCHHLSSFGKLPPSPLSDDVIFEWPLTYNKIFHLIDYQFGEGELILHCPQIAEIN